MYWLVKLQGIANLVCHTSYCGYIHGVTMTLCGPSIKMY